MPRRRSVRARALAWAITVLAALGVAAPAALAGRGGDARSGPAPAHLSARAAILVDSRDGSVLFAQAAEARRPIASTTKLMTALLTLERTRPDETFVAPGYAPTSTAEVTIGLVKGERMTVHDLLRALLLPSANDAAFDLAVGIAGSETRFVDEMNARARALGLTETHYSNPIGLDSPANYSSARDLARLASILLRQQAFAAVVSAPSTRLVSGDAVRTVFNRNDLVGRYPFVTGVKTGHTTAAGHVLVASARRGDAEVVSVVLGEPSVAARDADTLALLRYGLGRFRLVVAVRAAAPLARARVRYFSRRVALVAARTVAVTTRLGLPVVTRVSAPARVTGPLPAGTAVGSVAIVAHGRVVRTVPLLTAAAVPAAGWPQRVAAAVGLSPAALACLVLLGVAAVAAAVLMVRRMTARREEADDHHRHPQRGDR